MGRPQKNNCDYFRHFTTMRNHRKVKALRNKFDKPNAPVGYAFWSMMMEYLTEADGNEMEDSEMELELFGGELGVSVTEIRSMVDFCVRMEMLFIVDGFIHSESLDEDLEFVYKKRKIAKDRSATRKRRKNGTFDQKRFSSDSNDQDIGISVTDTPNGLDISVAESPQIRVDKINKENIKRKQEDSFINFWNLYEKKIGKPKAFRQWLKLTDDEKLKIMLYLPKYKLTKEKQFRKDPERFLRHKCWNDELVSADQKTNGEVRHTEYITDPNKFYNREGK